MELLHSVLYAWKLHEASDKYFLSLLYSEATVILVIRRQHDKLESAAQLLAPQLSSSIQNIEHKYGH